MHLVRRSNEECPMLPSDYYHRRLRFIFALMLTLCLISSALPPQSRAAASTDDGTALVMSGAGRGRKNTGGETYQLPASPLEETPLRTGEINIAGRVIMLPGRLDNHKSDAPRGTVVALRGSRSFILHPIPKLTANHVPDYSAIARGETARSTRTVAASEHAGKPSGTGLLAATRNVFAIAPRVVSLSRKPPIGVFTQGWNKAPQPSDHTAHLAETRTEARVASSNQSALTTGGTDAPHVSAMLTASGNPEASGEAKTEANNSPPLVLGSLRNPPRRFLNPEKRNRGQINRPRRQAGPPSKPKGGERLISTSKTARISPCNQARQPIKRRARASHRYWPRRISIPTA